MIIRGFVLFVLLAGLVASVAMADTIVSVVGDDTRTSASDSTSATLTGGWISTNLGWTHTYSALSASDIISATLVIDILDAETTGYLRMYAGTDATDPLIGDAYGINSGGPGSFYELGHASTIETSFSLASSLFADIADGTFDVWGVNTGLAIWGSNRAQLTIVTSGTPAVPEPATILLLGAGLCGLVVRRRRARA